MLKFLHRNEKIVTGNTVVILSKAVVILSLNKKPGFLLPGFYLLS
jgi:hypothetical protein